VSIFLLDLPAPFSLLLPTFFFFQRSVVSRERFGPSLFFPPSTLLVDVFCWKRLSFLFLVSHQRRVPDGFLVNFLVTRVVFAGLPIMWLAFSAARGHMSERFPNPPSWLLCHQAPVNVVLPCWFFAVSTRCTNSTLLIVVALPQGNFSLNPPVLIHQVHGMAHTDVSSMSIRAFSVCSFRSRRDFPSK